MGTSSRELLQSAPRVDSARVIESLPICKHIAFLEVKTFEGLCDKLENIARESGRGLAETSDMHAFYDWWRFLAKRQDPMSRAMWQGLRDRKGSPGKSRDAHMLELWRKLRELSPNPKNNRAEVVPGSNFLDEEKHSRRYHEDLMFGWFLARYDIYRALQCFRAELSWLRRLIVGWMGAFIFAAVLVGLVFWLFAQLPAGATWPWRLASVVAMYGIYVGALMWGGSLRWAPAVQALIPRLMGTAAVGFLFLLNTEAPFREWLVPESGKWYGPALLFVAAWLYLVLEIVRRVDPDPTLWERASRSSRVLLMGAAHSSALFVVLGPELPLRNAAAQRLGAFEVAGLVLFVLAVGLVLNVIWAEEPVTEPL